MLASLTILALLAASPTAEVRADPCEARDEKGDPFRICFDPGNRFALLALPGASWGNAGVADHLSLSVDWRVRASRESRSLRDATWSTEHRILPARIDLQSGLAPQLAVAGYDGLFERHLAEGFILLPTANPIRLPFPFDIAIASTFASWERERAVGWGDRLEVVRCALLLDAARDPSGLTRLAIGPELAYAVARPPDGAVEHQLEPLTGGQVRLRRESPNGLWAAELQGSAGWVIVPGAPSGLQATGQASIERVVVALNDQPISLRLDARGVDRAAGPSQRELVVGLGLVAAWSR